MIAFAIKPENQEQVNDFVYSMKREFENKERDMVGVIAIPGFSRWYIEIDIDKNERNFERIANVMNSFNGFGNSLRGWKVYEDNDKILPYCEAQ